MTIGPHCFLVTIFAGICWNQASQFTLFPETIIGHFNLMVLSCILACVCFHTPGYRYQH